MQTPPTANRTVDFVFVDLFGTLLSMRGLDISCEALASGRGAEIAARWRARQLEFSWLRTVMNRWVDFDVVTRDALASAVHELGIPATATQVEAMTDAFAGQEMASGAAAALAA